MKLWILRPVEDLEKGDNPWEPWYDKVFGFVVRAGNEKEARIIAQENAGDEKRRVFLGKKMADTSTPWLDVKYSTCVELEANGEAEMIMKDFAAT